MWPVKPPRGAARPRITVGFRVPGSAWILGYHPGTDIGWTRKNKRGKVTERVRAAYKGVVYYVGRGDRFYGNYVVIWHPDIRRWSWYCHLDTIRPTIKKGTKVGTGRWLGYMGSTGNATGEHTHYEERIGGNRYHVDDIVAPILFTRRRPPYKLKMQGWR